MMDYRGWKIDFEDRNNRVVVFIAQEIGCAKTLSDALEMGKEEIDKIFPEEPIEYLAFTKDKGFYIQEGLGLDDNTEVLDKVENIPTDLMKHIRKVLK